MKSKASNLIPAAFCGVVFGLIIIFVWNYPPHARRLLLIMGWIGFFLAALLAVNELRLTKRVGEQTDTTTDKHAVPTNTFLKTSGWIVSIFVLVYLLGFTVGISLYVLAYYRSHGGRWWASITLGAVMAAVVYFGFAVGLEIKFPIPPLLPFLRW